MKKIAIFDLDGTILDTLEDLADSVNYCLNKFGLPKVSLLDVRKFVGNGIHRLVEQAVPSGTDNELVDAIYEELCVYYKDHCAIKTKPYSGIREILIELRGKGIYTAVVSNKADEAVKCLCKDYFDGLFDFSVGERNGTRRKPFPDSVNAVLEYFKLSPNDGVYIGDSEVDYLTAKNANMDLIMVGWGFRDKEDLINIGANEVILTREELLKEILAR